MGLGEVPTEHATDEAHVDFENARSFTCVFSKDT